MAAPRPSHFTASRYFTDCVSCLRRCIRCWKGLPTRQFYSHPSNIIYRKTPCLCRYLYIANVSPILLPPAMLPRCPLLQMLLLLLLRLASPHLVIILPSLRVMAIIIPLLVMPVLVVLLLLPVSIAAAVLPLPMCLALIVVVRLPIFIDIFTI